VDARGFQKLLRAVQFKVVSKEELKKLFKRFDRDRNGVIEWREFEEFMKVGLVAFSAQLSMQLSASKVDSRSPSLAVNAGSFAGMSKLFGGASGEGASLSPPSKGRRQNLSIDTSADENY
jgi:hypothetical protein